MGGVVGIGSGNGSEVTGGGGGGSRELKSALAGVEGLGAGRGDKSAGREEGGARIMVRLGEMEEKEKIEPVRGRGGSDEVSAASTPAATAPTSPIARIRTGGSETEKEIASPLRSPTKRGVERRSGKRREERGSDGIGRLDA